MLDRCCCPTANEAGSRPEADCLSAGLACRAAACALKMGNVECCARLSDEERAAVAHSRTITQANRQDYARQSSVIKLLLLGAGESGKSTIVKQMKIIHTSGFTREDCLAFRYTLHTNLIESLRSIVQAMDLLVIDFEQESNVELAADLANMELKEGELLNVEQMEMLQTLWRDAGVLRCFGRSREYQLSDGASFLLDNIDMYKDEEFVPREEDILHIRVETKGIIEVNFTYKETQFVLFDVGGQRSQRRKWIHCFDNVMAIIFCTALSGYDTVLVEDGTTNRMIESLSIFQSICNSEIFEKTSLLLFLNKTDLLRRKVQDSPLSTCFPEYKGPNDYESVAAFIEIKFLETNRKRLQEKIYVHRTCATDTTTVKSVFRVAAQAIMRENLERCGLM
ncbi:guanine nucleotide-binding protein G(o) subunit alpha-like [Sycon ciliatum]|uniref:guanine nucleotide-binding protein G(o) subunit alpha-like n=1 Tax=Sycon ciliatum TaxID=27933 RepID=UPI0020AAD514|eukprot:scpid22699/ scgid28060/ Guanine nucleotide-binding protein G(o) subunit alpha